MPQVALGSEPVSERATRGELALSSPSALQR